eukprot:13355779-Alexandrium_andersonii.AAC.1
MSGGVPEDPPGLEQRGPSAKRSRSAGASSRTSPTPPSDSSKPMSFGPPGTVGAGRRAPEG